MLPKFPSGGGNKGGFSSTWSSYLPYVDTFKKRACRFILHHYLGRFLKDHLTLDQLTIDLYNGTGSLHNVPIDIYSVNDVLESQGIPIELVSGDIATITVSIPWSNIFQNASKVEIRSLNIAIKGQSASSDSTFLTESYFNSLMNTSMQVAQKCLKDDELTSNFGSSPPSSLDSRSEGHHTQRSGNRQQQQGEAVEFFAQAIETVLLKVRISLIDTKIRFETSDPYSDSIEIVVKKIDFFDDSVSEEENVVNSSENEAENEATPQFFTSNFCTKVFKLEGMSINHVPNSCNVNKAMTEVLTTEELNEAMGRSQNGEKGVSPAKIGEFLGKLEAKVKMKQNPSVSGAKLSVDCMLGSLSLFTQPKHIKVLIDVLDGFINSSAPNALHEPPLEPSLRTGMNDKSGLMFATCQFENEINMHQNLPTSLGAPGNRRNPGQIGLYQGHERVPVEMPSYYPNNTSVVYNDDDFYSIYDDASEHNSMTSSMISGTTTTATTQAFDQRKERSTDKHHDPTMVNIRLNGLSLVLLESTTEDFKALSDNFYLKLHEVTNLRCGFGPKDAYDQKKLIESACDLNHITLLACPVNMRVILNQSKKSSKSNALLTFAFFEITECLNTPTEKQESTILTFANQKNFAPNDILAQPNMKIDITWSSSTGKTDLSEPKKRVNFLLDLMPTILNVDLTLLDRLFEFFKPETRTKPEIFTASNAFVLDPEKDIMEENSTATVSSFELRCPDLDLTFYIPIPIFEEEKSLLVSTQRLIRNEAFEFQFSSMSLKFDFTKIEEDLSVCLEANSIDMLLVSSVVSLRLCRISSDQRSKPFVSFKLYPFHCELESANHFDMNTASMYDSFPCDFASSSRGKKSPFSSKVVIHNSQPVVNCGTHKEMREFADECLGDSRLVLKISLPHVSFFIPNKAVFDLVYNRFSNDLLLWEPLFSKLTPAESLTGSGSSKVGLGLASQAAAISRGKQHFSMCKSGIRSAYGNLSQGSEDGETTLDGEDENGSLYGESESDRDASQNWLSLQVKFGTVQLALSDVDKNNADIVSFQSFSDLKNGTLFVVAGHAGCSDTTIITMSCFDGQYYHSEEEASCKPFSFDEQLNVKFPSYLDMKLRKSRLDMLQHQHQESFSNPLLSMAVRIHANKAKNFKHIKVAVNAEGVTLFHRFDQHQWYDDLLEMFSPRDEPIPGYKFLPVMTELHISLTNCAILYRPLHLPYTVVLNTGCCYMSSNVVAESPSSIFQIVVEAASLYLSCSRSLKSKLSDFAKIADTGLISLDVITQKRGHSSSSKYNKKKSETQGTKTEIRLSCDIFNLYTCSDSLKVISEIIQYLAASGDCPERIIPEDVDSDVIGKTTKNPEELAVLVGDKRDSLVVTENKVNSGDGANGGVNLNQMIQSAINEDMVASMHQDYTEVLQNVFLFPDDAHGKAKASPQSSTSNSSSSIQTESLDQSRGDLSPTSNQDSSGHPESIGDVDQEFSRSAARAVITSSPSDSVEGEVENLLVASQFCVIESPFVRKSSYEGDCSILCLDNEELQLVENHFEKPMPGKRDMLKAASYLPTPLCKYNVQEFNVSWKLYAGHDFPSASGMQYGRDKTNLVDVCLQKIELLYEQYSHPKYKSRLAIACDDVEVLDRISASSINKMLYCYSAENCLRQAHAHMVLFKSLECSPSETSQEGSEYIVRLNLLPVRLNFDQRTIFFLSDFFADSDKSNIEIFNNNNETKKGGKVKFALAAGDGKSNNRVSFKNSESEKLRVELPPMSENSTIGQEKKELLPSVDGNPEIRSATLPTSCKSVKGSPMKSRSPPRAAASSGRSTSFIKEFCFLSDVLIKFDYQGQYLDMDRGRLVGLLVGLAQVQCSQLVLKKIQANHGILGFDNLVLYCVTEWLKDIKKNQIPTLLGGIGPIYSFTQIMHGLIDLVCMPIEQYRRDGRLLKGFQRGAASFTTSSTAAALQLTNRLISAIHFTAETAFDLLSPNPRKAILPPPHSRHAAQPNDFREGLNMAYKTLYEGLSDTATTLVQEAVDGKDTRGLTGAVGGVLRQIPPTLIAPVILASEATSTVIDGVSHQLVPDCRHEALNKWKY